MSLEKENQALTTKNSSQTDAFCSDGEKSDGATFGQSLIKFMTLATGSVKTALQKQRIIRKKSTIDATYKNNSRLARGERNVRRKQKQDRNCSDRSEVIPACWTKLNMFRAG